MGDVDCQFSGILRWGLLVAGLVHILPLLWACEKTRPGYTAAETDVIVRPADQVHAEKLDLPPVRI